MGNIEQKCPCKNLSCGFRKQSNKIIYVTKNSNDNSQISLIECNLILIYMLEEGWLTYSLSRFYIGWSTY